MFSFNLKYPSLPYGAEYPTCLESSNQLSNHSHHPLSPHHNYIHSITSVSINKHVFVILKYQKLQSRVTHTSPPFLSSVVIYLGEYCSIHLQWLQKESESEFHSLSYSSDISNPHTSLSGHSYSLDVIVKYALCRRRDNHHQT